MLYLVVNSNVWALEISYIMSILPNPVNLSFLKIKSSLFVKLIVPVLKTSTEFLEKSFSSQLKNPNVLIFNFLVGLKIAFKDSNSALLKLVLDSLKLGV